MTRMFTVFLFSLAMFGGDATPAAAEMRSSQFQGHAIQNGMGLSQGNADRTHRHVDPTVFPAVCSKLGGGASSEGGKWMCRDRNGNEIFAIEDPNANSTQPDD